MQKAKVIKLIAPPIIDSTELIYSTKLVMHSANHILILLFQCSPSEFL